MEAIDGEYIDRWCDHRRLPLAKRLELLRKVCAAVDYAHRNLVLHQDIKPSNLLVTHDGTPKLLDFGIAKVLDPDDDGTPNGTAAVLDMPVLTRAGDRILTPEFASPEQLRGEVLTTASDVYSLGVLAYLLVSGRHPYAFASRRLAEIERVVCEIEPTPPSTAVRRAQQDAGTTPGPWPGPARSEDLDRIVLMALDSYAQLWNKRQAPRRAEEILRQVYEEGRRRLGEEHPRVTDSLNNLAVALYTGGDLAGAEVFFQRLLEVNRRSFGERHRAVAVTLYNLGHGVRTRGSGRGSPRAARRSPGDRPRGLRRRTHGGRT